MTVKNIHGILTGDWHLRTAVPICRTDDFFAAMEKKVTFISDLQRKYNVPILDSGDLFESWYNQPYLLAWAIMNMPKGRFLTVAGNHDLQNHNLSLLNNSSLGLLEAAAIVEVLGTKNGISSGGLFDKFIVNGCPWTEEPIPIKDDIRKKHVLLAHYMTYQGELPWHGLVATDSAKLLKRVVGYDLIVTGHNHMPFVEKVDGRLLVNPGSMMRLKADQIDHKPRVYLWDADENDVEPVFLPIEEGVVSREHIASEKERNDRAEAFVQSVNTRYEVEVKFVQNLESFYSKNKVTRAIKALISRACGKG